MATFTPDPSPVTAAMQIQLERAVHRSSAFDSKTPRQMGEYQVRLQRSSSHGLLRKRHQMQLPSFEKLGISAYSPNSPELGHPNSHGQARPLSIMPTNGRPNDRLNPPALHQAYPFLGGAPLLTPPDDISSIKWNKAVSQGSGSASSLERSPSIVEGISVSGATSSGQNYTPAASHTQEAGEPSGSGQSPSSGSEQDSDPGKSMENVLELGIGTNISLVSTPDARTNGVTVISQTLPHPIQDSNPHSVFTPMIQAIQSHFEGRDGQRPPYIRITHAVPPQFSLRNLPSSPPSTPSGQGEEDYFSLNIFANAAPVPTYHLVDGSVDRSAPHSPAPIVPPATVQVALVERYIPPSTSAEHDAFFSLHGPSVLIDRLCELSAGNGSLMLIYPTKRGGQTFRSDHVGPLLDSFLRTMVVVNDMSSDLASSLGRMPAISHMLGFQDMKDKVDRLCKHLSRPKSSTSRGSKYSMVYADVGEVPLDRDTWSEWFLQQETPRMRTVLKSYWQRGQKLPTSKDTVIPATLLRDIKNCVEEGQYEDGKPTSAIEVGVFVIRRTR